MTHIVEVELEGGPAALLSGWSELSRSALATVADGDGGKAPGAAILIFMTGAEEINRTVLLPPNFLPLPPQRENSDAFLQPMH